MTDRPPPKPDPRISGRIAMLVLVAIFVFVAVFVWMAG
jgi:hypothetical protein